MNAYYKETGKPFGYLLVDNKACTPPDNQILPDLFGECYAYHFGVSSTVEPTPAERLQENDVTTFAISAKQWTILNSPSATTVLEETDPSQLS